MEYLVSQTATEIASQPRCWQRAAETGRAARGALPAPGERTAVVGCGTSWFIAQSYAVLRETAGAGETDAWAASEFPAGRSYDRIVAISRSGTTSEVVDLLAHVRGTAPVTVLTAVPDSPLARLANHPVVLDYADEKSVVQTRFATSVLAALRASLGEDLTSVVNDAEQALTVDLPAQAVAADQITFLGSGWTYGLAQEAALKLRETATAWTESYPTMEYRHGPVSITTAGRAVWIFGTVPDGMPRDIAATGGTLIAGSGPAPAGTGASSVDAVSASASGGREVARPLDPMADLVRVQRLAVVRAHAGGHDPDRPRHLTRSVILEPTEDN